MHFGKMCEVNAKKFTDYNNIYIKLDIVTNENA